MTKIGSAFESNSVSRLAKNCQVLRLDMATGRRKLKPFVLSVLLTLLVEAAYSLHIVGCRAWFHQRTRQCCVLETVYSSSRQFLAHLLLLMDMDSAHVFTLQRLLHGCGKPNGTPQAFARKVPMVDGIAECNRASH